MGDSGRIAKEANPDPESGALPIELQGIRMSAGGTQTKYTGINALCKSSVPCNVDRAQVFAEF